MNEEYLWNRSGEPDEEIVRLERLLAPLGYKAPAAARDESNRSYGGSRRLRSWWRELSPIPFLMRGSVTSWQLASGGQDSRGAAHRKRAEASLLKIESDATGQVRIDPGSRLRMVAANPGEERFNLERGTIHAFIWAPPGRFVVDTPSAKTIDLGCQYTLQVSKNGTGLLTVETGWVAFESRGIESFIPAGAACITRPGHGPGTPHFTDASAALTAALESFDNTSDPKALNQAVANARPRDTLTLWHLLTRTHGEQRAEVFARFAAVVPLPSDVSREAILRGDPAAFDAAWNALNLGDTDWWRGWKRQW